MHRGTVVFSVIFQFPFPVSTVAQSRCSSPDNGCHGTLADVVSADEKHMAGKVEFRLAASAKIVDL